ncbi:hypothetical protein INT45_007647 [Circinella minor]|uniref:PSP1 C-terminal domain-containing protein n=1 Tax=Circinella minor TaxID=1195481 RepID=A0A8H7RYI4_9FUNG|nr:hypothetical protein INT45_007647 [Circinella minor]
MTTVNNEKNNNKSTWSNNNNNSTNNTNDSGFQWEGPSIFDNNNDHAPAHEVVPPDMIDETNNNNNNDNDNSILSVPMLPGVSMEPIYRQHRSLSFSMGQDPTFFGYDDYSDDDDSNNNNPTNNSTTTTTTNNNTKVYKNSLETMKEEEEEDEGKENGQQRTLLLGEDEFNTNRMRSKSSGAALSMLSSFQQDYLSDRYDENNNKNDRGSVEQEDKAKEAWNGIITTTSSDSQGHMNSNTTTSMTPDPVQRLAEQIEAMQFQQQQQQQQSVYNNNIPPTTSGYPITGMSPHTHTHPHSHHHPTEIYSHLPPPPHTQPYYSNHHQQHEIYQEGKGVALHQLPAETLLYMIEFKAGRTDFFYVIPNNNSQQSMPHLGDLVIVEADRGKDLGKIAKENLTPEEILNLKKQQQHEQQQEELEENNDPHSNSSSPSSPLSSLSNEQQQQGSQEMKLSDIQIKRIYRQALPDEISVLLMKSQDEQRALLLCQQKTKQRKLPMEVVDAEYQWDRRKLTFYFVAERRIDFRELVRELFKIYKTRIWMCAVNPTNTN